MRPRACWRRAHRGYCVGLAADSSCGSLTASAPPPNRLWRPPHTSSQHGRQCGRMPCFGRTSMVTLLIATLDWFGVVVFAVTGALVASRKQMDIFGFALLATVTGVGGGSVRDVLLGDLPVFWVKQPAYVVIC